MKKLKIQLLSAVLILSLIISLFPMQAFASQENTPKEEVVYINLNSDGSVKEINVVNIFDLDEEGQIIDYGEYENLRNMTTTDDIKYANGTITIDAGAGKLYYEGRLTKNVMPWDISIKYFMDGKEYSADEIAGMSGKLEIRMSVKKNPDCDSTFFEGFALQVTFTLDTDNATNILADGATLANVGSNKQLTYTILPNTEKDITVSADVKDFEMTGISINGIRMEMEVNMDDTVLHEKVDEVIEASNDLNNGAGELDDGASELYDASQKLNNATEELYDGVGTLYNGCAELENGLKDITSKNSEINDAAWAAYEALCSAAQKQINAQLVANGFNPVTLTPSTYSDVLSVLISYFDGDMICSMAYNTALTTVTKEVEAQAGTLYEGYIRSQADNICLAYIQSQADALYMQAAYEAVFAQLVESGYYNEDTAREYLATPGGIEMVTNAVSAMDEEQKETIITTAFCSLTPAQKEQILQGALSSLTDTQKADIRNTYIEQLMASDEVKSKIYEGVKEMNNAVAEMTALKDYLDNFGKLYNGVAEYTNAVSSAADGASELKSGMSTLYDNTDTFKSSVGDFHTAIGTLKNGTAEMKDGTQEFVSETAGMHEKIDSEINSIKSSITGENVRLVSFVSAQNTNIKMVQFVIQTESIKIDEPQEPAEKPAEKLTFWQKLIRLFM